MTGFPDLQASPSGTTGTADIRVAGPLDREKIKAFIKGLSPDTQYARFHGFPDDRSMPYLCGEKGDAILVAEAGDEGGNMIVGHVMIAPLTGTSAGEIAFVVDDAWQRCGIATRLIESAAAWAHSRGLDTLIAYIQDDQDGKDRKDGEDREDRDPAPLRLLRRLSTRVHLDREDEETQRAEIPLPLTPPGGSPATAATTVAEQVRPAHARVPRRARQGDRRTSLPASRT